MKIRTITSGCNLKKDSFKENKSLITDVIDDTNQIKQYFEDSGYMVQTSRFSTQPWEKYAKTPSDINQICSFLQSLCPDRLDYYSLGPIETTDQINQIGPIIKKFPRAFSTVHLVKRNQVLQELTWKTAELIKTIAGFEQQGFANLRFAALCNVKPNTPFFPASYHAGKPSFGIGCENSDVIYQVFTQSSSIKEAEELLNEQLTIMYQKIEKLAKEISKKTGLYYHGIDASISPSVQPTESLVYGIEHLPWLQRFGDPGTLAAARFITSVIQQLPLSHCGYSGLMLPVMEDHGLAKRNQEGKLSLTKLLLYSSVCGTGLDTIPLPGDISIELLYGILLDVAHLSVKLEKPLSARLMPIPGKKADEPTEFTFEYFENTTVMNP